MRISAHGGDGRPRFTPPAQIINALNTALDFFDAEGGRAARLARYTRTCARFMTAWSGLA